MTEEAVSEDKVEAGRGEDGRLQLREVVSLQVMESYFLPRNTFRVSCMPEYFYAFFFL